MFREPKIVNFGQRSDLLTGMIVMEEPIGSIFRYDYVLPTEATPAQQCRVFAAILRGLADDYEEGKTRFGEGEEGFFTSRRKQ